MSQVIKFELRERTPFAGPGWHGPMYGSGTLWLCCEDMARLFRFSNSASKLEVHVVNTNIDHLEPEELDNMVALKTSSKRHGDFIELLQGDTWIQFQVAPTVATYIKDAGGIINVFVKTGD
jgi:hypothetical protein